MNQSAKIQGRDWRSEDLRSAKDSIRYGRSAKIQGVHLTKEGIDLIMSYQIRTWFNK